MKRAMFLLCAAMAWCTAQAQRPALRFDAEGRFRIVQFTDVHLDLSTPYRQGEAAFEHAIAIIDTCTRAWIARILKITNPEQQST